MASEIFKCFSCKKNFSGPAALRAHCTAKKHLPGLQCTKCYETIMNHERAINDHFKRYHRPFKCGDCDSTFCSAEALNNHRDDKHNHSCGECNRVFSSAEKLNSHAGQAHVHRCGFCGKVFHEKTEFDRHFKDHVPAPVEMAPEGRMMRTLRIISTGLKPKSVPQIAKPMVSNNKETTSLIAEAERKQIEELKEDLEKENSVPGIRIAPLKKSRLITDTSNLQDVAESTKPDLSRALNFSDSVPITSVIEQANQKNNFDLHRPLPMISASFRVKCHKSITEALSVSESVAPKEKSVVKPHKALPRSCELPKTGDINPLRRSSPPKVSRKSSFAIPNAGTNTVSLVKPPPGTIECKLCPALSRKSFLTTGSLDDHQWKKHKTQMLKEETAKVMPSTPPGDQTCQVSLFECNNCGGKFDTADLLGTHKDSYHSLKCEDCSVVEVFENAAALQNHWNAVHIAPCCQCGERYFQGLGSVASDFICRTCEMRGNSSLDLLGMDNDLDMSLSLDMPGSYPYEENHNSTTTVAEVPCGKVASSTEGSFFSMSNDAPFSSVDASVISADPQLDSEYNSLSLIGALSSESLAASHRSFKEVSTQTTIHRCDECVEVFDDEEELQLHLHSMGRRSCSVTNVL